MKALKRVHECIFMAFTAAIKKTHASQIKGSLKDALLSVLRGSAQISYPLLLGKNSDDSRKNLTLKLVMEEFDEG